MTNPIYKCPHCKKDVELKLTDKGLILLFKKGVSQ